MAAALRLVDLAGWIQGDKPLDLERRRWSVARHDNPLEPKWWTGEVLLPWSPWRATLTLWMCMGVYPGVTIPWRSTRGVYAEVLTRIAPSKVTEPRSDNPLQSVSARCHQPWWMYKGVCTQKL